LTPGNNLSIFHPKIRMSTGDIPYFVLKKGSEQDNLQELSLKKDNIEKTT